VNFFIGERDTEGQCHRYLLTSQIDGRHFNRDRFAVTGHPIVLIFRTDHIFQAFCPLQI